MYVHMSESLCMPRHLVLGALPILHAGFADDLRCRSLASHRHRTIQKAKRLYSTLDVHQAMHILVLDPKSCLIGQ